MEATIDAQIASLIGLVQKIYISTSEQYRPMDFAEKGQSFTLDVISSLAFGKPFGYLEQDADVSSYIKTIEQAIPAMATMSNIPWLARLTQTRLFRGLQPKESDKLGFGAFIGYTLQTSISFSLTSSSVARKLVHERFQQNQAVQGEKSDMMASFISHGLSEEEVAGESLLQVLAGSDTTATTIRVILLQILTHPSCYQCLQSEFATAIKAGGVSSPIRDVEAK